uniref:SH2 domain-containing protein n=1 Tax=Tetraodon nigroviridis TaxID=99883 RepID=H3BWR3_TETNG
MSSERVPSRSEVMGWGPHQLSEYLKRMNLSGCDKVVLKNSISGSRFINLSDHDLQKFPKVHAPLISKISSEINKKDEKRGLFSRKPRYQEPEVTAESQGWDEDEFEEFDDDYESPYSGDDAESVEDYELPNDDVANDYEPPPSQPSEDLKHICCPVISITSTKEGLYNRNSHASFRGPPPIVTPRPSSSTISAPSPRMVNVSFCSLCLNTPGWLTEPATFRSGRVPGETSPHTPARKRQLKELIRTQLIGSQPDPHDLPAGPNLRPFLPPAPPSAGATPLPSTTPAPPPTIRFYRSDAKREQQPHDDVTKDHCPSSSHLGVKHNTFPLHNKKLPLCPGPSGHPSHYGDSYCSLPSNFPAAGSLPQKLQSAEQRCSFRGPDRQSFTSPTSKADAQDLDPCWYVGQVSRGQAEGCLKYFHKDGAYLVRDSVRQLAGQPFTLMVFYQEKVYNIQIRQQNNQFLLGTGLKVQEPFPSVRDIIYHYSQFPLLLIDAKKRSFNQQNQCLLSDPAGYL